MAGEARYVVGLGASAGGLEALERFFDHCPTQSGAAFIVVMHLSRNFRSMLDEVLARHTKMPVLPAAQGQQLEENTVYVIQPATILEVSGFELSVSSRPTIDPSGPPTH
ncbi:MAG: chemotaxis protein CheB, partial [Myxococcota bacterium]